MISAINSYSSQINNILVRTKDTAIRITETVAAIFTDLALLPVAGALLIFSLVKKNFDPIEIKKDKTPILLLHGSGFNQSQWILGHYFLNQKQYGSVFSLNFDGLASNDPNKGIDDYAAEKLSKKILEIKKITGLSKMILIGHSMGGLVAGQYAEMHASQDGVEIEHIISIATPWKGSPLLGHRAEDSKPKRYAHMSLKNKFREELVNKILESEKTTQRKHYNIGSRNDFMVPTPNFHVTENPERRRSFNHLGHYGLVASPAVWKQIRTWLDAIYLNSSL